MINESILLELDQQREPDIYVVGKEIPLAVVHAISADN